MLELRRGLLEEGEVPVSLALAGFARLPRCLEALVGILPDDLREAVARLRRIRLGEHERSVHEPSQEVQHVRFVDRPARADGLGRLEAEATGEDREAAKERLLVRGEQVVAPVHGRPERLVARHRDAAAARQETEAVIQAGRDLLHRQRPEASRGQFEGERDAIKAATDLGHRCGVGGR